MQMGDILHAVVVDECTLTVDELAQTCAVEPQWVLMHVEAGLLGVVPGAADGALQFASAELARARRLAMLERDMDANPEVAALVADLIEEVQQLRRRLRAAGRR
jgi:chaperone modulatory protein CbpM